MKLSFLILSVILLLGCQQNYGEGQEILFGDAVGRYEGECANYNSNINDLENRVSATLNITVADLDNINVNASCSQVLDQKLKLKSATASEIIFESTISQSEKTTLKYVAQTDSIILMQISDAMNILFSGVRE